MSGSPKQPWRRQNRCTMVKSPKQTNTNGSRDPKARTEHMSQVSSRGSDETALTTALVLWQAMYGVNTNCSYTQELCILVVTMSYFYFCPVCGKDSGDTLRNIFYQGPSIISLCVTYTEVEEFLLIGMRNTSLLGWLDSPVSSGPGQ